MPDYVINRPSGRLIPPMGGSHQYGFGPDGSGAGGPFDTVDKRRAALGFNIPQAAAGFTDQGVAMILSSMYAVQV